MRAFFVVVAGMAVLGCVGTQVASSQSPPNPFSVTEVTVAKGTWHGTAWTLKGGDKGTGSQFAACVFVQLAHQHGGGGCGMGGLPQPHPNPAAPDFPYGVTPAWTTACKQHGFGVLMGEVTIRAREVTVTFSSGAIEHTSPYPPPAGLAPTVGFFATTTPCDATITSIVGRDANGKVVARISAHFLHGMP